MRIRKQVYELTIEDLRLFPVWEFALDEEAKEGQNESTVRPYRKTFPLNPVSGSYVIKADFILADGTRKIGFLSSSSHGATNISAVQPTIVTEHGHVVLWYGGFAPGDHVLAEYYRRLEKNTEDVFPISYATCIKMIGEPIEGTVNAFIYFQYRGNRPFSPKSMIELCVK
jgi:hypothetical protein